MCVCIECVILQSLYAMAGKLRLLALFDFGHVVHVDNPMKVSDHLMLAI